ncbi:MAG: uracil-DNA glycosylase [Pyrinomonadaceae bacterium]
MADIGEFSRYLSELGVEGFQVSFSEVPARTKAPVAKSFDGANRIPASDFGVLRESLHAAAPQNSIDSSKNNPRRAEGLLGSTRIADIPAPARASAPRQKIESAPIENTSIRESEIDTVKPKRSGETLLDIRSEIGTDCSRCGLCENRTQIVNSIGNEKADLMIVGEAPGADEDFQGKPFVGKAGKLLTKILEAIGFERDDVFIGNINRCRPPGNRQPSLEESAMCKPFLLREIAAVAPKVIVVLGNTATKNLLDTTTGITQLRGNFQERFGAKVMPTFHPAYLLRDPRKKREVWDDMKKVRDFLS